MKRFDHSIIGMAAFLGILLITGSVLAQKGTVITNTADNPVRVKAVDNPAYNRYQVITELGDISSVPAGKIFVIEHISGSLMIESAAQATGTCRVYSLALSTGAVPLDVIPTYMGSAPGLNTQYSFFSFSQPVKAYVGPGSDFGGLTSGLSSDCKDFPLFFSRIAFFGYLVDAVN